MSFLSYLFGCRHKSTTFPQTKKKRTYIVCLDCGQEFNYNWKKMQICSQNKKRQIRKKRSKVVFSHLEQFNDWEQNFIENNSEFFEEHGVLSRKQLEVLDNLYRKIK